MITPPLNYHKIENDQHKLEIYKKYQLATKTQKEIKEILYKGIYSAETIVCDVVGYLDEMLIIKINDELHAINGDYLAQMQKKDFSSK